MSVISVGQSTVSPQIVQLAQQMLAPEQVPIQNEQSQLDALNLRSSVLTTLGTRFTTLNTELQTLAQPGTLSPFAANTASVSDNTVFTASAAANAVPGTVSVTVAQLAKPATFVSNLYTDTGTAISGAGTGTYSFGVSVGTNNYTVSVSVNPGDTDQTVMDNLATAINAQVGTTASAVRVETSPGQSRLSLASTNTGTANNITFTDTNGFLSRIGMYYSSPTAATDTTGGYVYTDLGNHELDAKLVVNGLTYYRSSNTINDLITGVTMTLKNTSSSTVTLSVQPDADAAEQAIKDFISKYNDVVTYLKQQTAFDPKAGTKGPLALDFTYVDLISELETQVSQVVPGQPSGTPNSLEALGITLGDDGTLSITDESTLKNSFTANPSAVESLFNGTNGVATLFQTFVNGYSKPGGILASEQSGLTIQINDGKARLDQMQQQLAVKQANLEDQLARNQALLQLFSDQSNQIGAIIAAAGTGG